ncbi:MAG: tRNA pseudouridine(38-40) synthase TruA [Verrucomicrobia bacterium]|nr:MAG: tRNA pseudouridine(38-40) synthase TruA [Verrucomicrobiota bacterium]
MEPGGPQPENRAPERADTGRTPPPGHVRWRLVVAYDGSAYQGWQWQKTGIGVQQRLEEALGRLFPSRPRVHASSRTDTGVHAMGMVVHFDLPRPESRLPARKLPLALNAWLPEDIRVRSAARCRGPFHARFDATGKQYRYFVWNHPAHNPLLRHQAWHVPRRLDLPRMREAAGRLVGPHDFAAFSTNPGYERGSTRRTLHRLELRRSGPLLTFVIEGDGFLYRMCRGLVGTLVQVGLGRFTPEDVGRMLAARDRRLGGMSAPPHGLVLWKVFYGKPRRGQPDAPAPGANPA